VVTMFYSKNPTSTFKRRVIKYQINSRHHIILKIKISKNKNSTFVNYRNEVKRFS